MHNGFDRGAPGYDDDFTNTPVERARRASVHRHLDHYVLPESGHISILELGCGAGEDAVFFASRGHRVLATDRSTTMLEIARSKGREAGLENLLSYRELDLTTCSNTNFQAPFDLVFSNFGVLNCLCPEEISHLAKKAATWVRPGGRLVLVIMPRHCIWETAYLLAQGPSNQALRRSRGGPANAQVSGPTVETWYHGSNFITTTFAPAFEQVYVRPVGLTIPPSQMSVFCNRHPNFLKVLTRLESVLQPIPGLAKIANHYLIDLRRTSARLVGNPKRHRIRSVVANPAPAEASTSATHSTRISHQLSAADQE